MNGLITAFLYGIAWMLGVALIGGVLCLIFNPKGSLKVIVHEVSNWFKRIGKDKWMWLIMFGGLAIYLTLLLW